MNIVQEKLEEAIAAHRAGRFEDAQRHYRAILALQPNQAEVHCELGSVLAHLAQWPAAIAEFQEAIRLAPDLSRAHFFLGSAHRIIGQLEQATQSLRHAVKLQPDFALGWERLGDVLLDRREMADAADAYQHAVALNPTALNYANLGSALGGADKMDESLAAMREAALLAPNWSEAQKGLGSILYWCGRQDEAIHAFRRALELEPANFAAHSALLYTMLFHGGFSPQQLLAAHIEWAERHIKDIMPLPPPANDRKIDRRLRVGYVSPNFRNQAVVNFILPIIENHDPWEVETFCYSDVIAPDDWTQRVKKHADEWRDTAALTHQQLAEQIRRDQIDILVDLTGHIGGGRLQAFAYRPAPIQVTYIGYQATTGLAAIDYFLTDDWADPFGQTERYLVEKPFRLPGSFFCYRSPPNPPDVAPLPALSAGHITFGSFNNLAKITSRTLNLWARLMSSVPNSRLMLMTPNSTEIRERIIAAGIPSDRLDLVHRVPLRQYLERYNQIDIALDPVPFNGHTTTCDAAWMGCPTVMLAGEIYAYRYGGTVLRNLGLSDLIASSEQDYIRIATDLAANLDRLSAIRSTLRSTMAGSLITDAKQFTHNLEQAYRQMWRDWSERQP